jgi:hypothetical protein
MGDFASPLMLRLVCGLLADFLLLLVLAAHCMLLDVGAMR